MPKSPNASQEIDSKQNVAKELVEPWIKCWMGQLRSSGVADDDSSTLFAKHAPLFGLRAPVPAFLSTEEAEHA